MKRIDVSIDKGAVLDDVKRLSANAAQQRGDALHVATDDDAEVLDRFFERVEDEIVMFFAPYAKDGLVFCMPESWDDALTESLKRGLKNAFVSGVLSKWYLLAGVDSVYLGMFAGSMEDIKRLLDSRKKPL